tara:strand:+ start:3218 stop:4321 length:1104 start_codon:yes stop_codon:yes gene_type:complete
VKNYKFLISGGGTGGHIYPALSIADELTKTFNSLEILFVGSNSRMEMQKVPKHGYKIKGLWISGIKRKLHFSNFLIPIKIFHSLIKSYFIIKKFKPDFVIGTGGFASGPLLFIASKLNIPTLIQEQNSYAGITNKILSKSVDLICVAYKNMNKYFPKNKILYTGNPVRNQINDLKHYNNDPYDFFETEDSNKVLLILGGSLGARKINEFVSENLNFFQSNKLNIIWQCGNNYFNTYKKFNSQNVKVLAFIENMNNAYNTADFIISRSGASVISELCIVGKPVLFIPSPNLAEDHQTKNALKIVENKAAVMVKEKDLNQRFFHEFKKIINDSSFSTKLSESIKLLAKPNATKEIVKNVKFFLNNDRKI